MEAGLDSTENSFCAREAAPRHRDRLAGGQGHGEEQHTHQGTLPGTGGARGPVPGSADLPGDLYLMLWSAQHRKWLFSRQN